MIVGKANGQHQSRLNLVVSDDGLHRPAAQAEDGYLRFVHDRRELPAADDGVWNKQGWHPRVAPGI
jgi:hypothetical protein